MSQYGHKLNPFRKLRENLAVKGIRTSVSVTNNPSTIDQNEQLLVRFPNLGYHDVIVPGTVRLAFDLHLVAAEGEVDEYCTIVQNIGRAIVKKTVVKISSNEVLSIDDSDVYHAYLDLWRSTQERNNLQYQGIDTSRSRNVTRLRMKATNADYTVAEDKAIADNLGNRFYIPLDFELLESHMPFYQAALGDRLEYELTFNQYKEVIVGETNMKYEIKNIALEFDKVTEHDLAREIRSLYNGSLSIQYDRVLRHRIIPADKSDAVWNINLNVPAKSMKGVLMLFKTPRSEFDKRTELFYNPKITSIQMTIEGVPNQLYSQHMRKHNFWDEIKKLPTIKRHPITNMVAKDLCLSDMDMGSFLTSKYALWLDLRTTDDDELHGSGRRVENGSEGMTISMTKDEEIAGPIHIYLYILMDAQLNIENGRFQSVVY